MQTAAARWVKAYQAQEYPDKSLLQLLCLALLAGSGKDKDSVAVIGRLLTVDEDEVDELEYQARGRGGRAGAAQASLGGRTERERDLACLRVRALGHHIT